MVKDSKQLQIGKAGEYITCADLIIMGLIAYPSEQGLPYDVVVDTGHKLLKCQVKTTQKPREIPQRNQKSLAYIFNIKRNGNGNKKKYEDGDIDFFALVELEGRSVVYLTNKEMPDTINIRVDYLKGKYYDEKGIIDYLNCLDLQKTIPNKSEIARKLNLDRATVGRYLHPNFKPFQTNARYWSDYKKDKEWFLNL